MTEKLHSRLGASSAHRWMACPGSVELCKSAPPQRDSEYAEEGTQAHELAEVLLTKRPKKKEGKPKEVPADMMEAVMLYVNTVEEDQRKLNGVLEVEKRVDLSGIHREMFGTNDALVYARWSKLIVYDYKHGKGVAVDVVDNVQLLFYALGAYLALQELEFSEVELVIVQPRAEHIDGPVRRWSVPVHYLTSFAERLKEAALATAKKDAPLVPGMKQCRWCPAMAICPAVAKKAQEVAAVDFAEPVEKALLAPDKLTPAQLKMALDNLPYLDAWLKAIEQYAEDQVKAGFSIPGYKLVKKRANRAWVNEAETIKSLTPKFGKKIYSEPELLSPAQMEKMIGKKNGGTTIVETLSAAPEAGVVLVPEDDKRPAVAAPALTDFQ